MTPRPIAIGLAFGLLAGACAAGTVDSTSGREPDPPHSSSATHDAGSSSSTTRPDAAPDDDAAPGGGDAGNDLDAAGGADVTPALDATSPVDAGPPPTVDGTIAPGEYGVHVDGQNMQASPGTAPTTTWYMTWSDTYLYVAVSAANVAEGVVFYVDHGPGSPDGSLAGTNYDGTRIASLPMHADFVAYVKSTYQEYRTADGANGWTAPVTSGITVQGTGSVREIAIPWSAIHPGGRPASFAWLGYVTSASGYAYGPMPTTNAGGFLGANATYSAFYRVTDATPGSGTKPFAVVGP